MSSTARKHVIPPLPQGLLSSCALLSLVVLLVLPLGAWYNGTRHGAMGIVAALVGAAVCWVGAMAALVVATKPRRAHDQLTAVFLGMLLRTGFPLLGAFVLTAASRELADAGVFACILMFYLPTLCAETYLSVRLLNSRNNETKVS